jgi:hypothetical protein
MGTPLGCTGGVAVSAAALTGMVGVWSRIFMTFPLHHDNLPTEVHMILVNYAHDFWP